jgi:hypothetical protein
MTDGIRTPDLPSASLFDEMVAGRDAGAGMETVRIARAAVVAQLGPELQLSTAILPVQTRSLATPPGSPTAGQAWIVASSPTGAWAGKTNDIARWTGSAWQFITPGSGFSAFVIDEFAYYAWKTSPAAWTKIFDEASATTATTQAGIATTQAGIATTQAAIAAAEADVAAALARSYASTSAGIDTALKTALAGNIVGGSSGANGSYNITIPSPNGGTSAVVQATISGGALTAAAVTTPGTRFLESVQITNAQIVAAGATGLTGASATLLPGGGVDFGAFFSVLASAQDFSYDIFQNVSGTATATNRSIINGRVVSLSSYGVSAPTISGATNWGGACVSANSKSTRDEIIYRIDAAFTVAANDPYLVIVSDNVTSGTDFVASYPLPPVTAAGVVTWRGNWSLPSGCYAAIWSATGGLGWIAAGSANSKHTNTIPTTGTANSVSNRNTQLRIYAYPATGVYADQGADALDLALMKPAYPALPLLGRRIAAFGTSWFDSDYYITRIENEARVAILNYGISGGSYSSSSTIGAGNVISQMDRCPSDVDGYYLGAPFNDFRGGVAVGNTTDTAQTTLCGAYSVAISLLQAINPAAPIYLETMPSFSYAAENNWRTPNGAGARITDFNAAIRAMADQYGCKVIDLARSAGLNGGNIANWSGDGLHPTLPQAQKRISACAHNEFRLSLSAPTDQVATPVMTYSAGNVTITCATAGATIRYTTDGSQPTTSSTAYSAPIAVASNAETAIRAQAFATNFYPSVTARGVFTNALTVGANTLTLYPATLSDLTSLAANLISFNAGAGGGVQARGNTNGYGCVIGNGFSAIEFELANVANQWLTLGSGSTGFFGVGGLTTTSIATKGSITTATGNIVTASLSSALTQAVAQRRMKYRLQRSGNVLRIEQQSRTSSSWSLITSTLNISTEASAGFFENAGLGVLVRDSANFSNITNIRVGTFT